jgi:hypothetical protein
MRSQMFNHGLPLATLLVFATGCSSDCAPTDTGGVLVEVSGESDCARLGVTATDGNEQFPFDVWPASETDGGPVCSFRGLAGHSGTFVISVSLDGQVVDSRTVTVERLDSCNVSSKLLTFDVGQA